LAVAAAISVALIGGMATPGHAGPAVAAPDSPVKTLLAYTPSGGALYADAAVPGVTPVLYKPGAAKTAALPGEGDCGIATCSYYFTRSETKKIHRNIALYGGGINGLAGACGLITLMSGPAATVVGVVCGISIAAYGQFFINATNHAVADNRCLRVRWLSIGGGYTFHSDNSKFCKN
jgi:hypothetical protein